MPKWPLSSPKPFTTPPPADAAHPRLGSWAVIALIRLYRLVLRPVLPPACRFAPTCSAFAVEAIARHGLRRGVALAAGRVGRCHPWHVGGHDPVPAPEV